MTGGRPGSGTWAPGPRSRSTSPGIRGFWFVLSRGSWSGGGTGYGEHVPMEITAGLVARGHIIVGTGSYGFAGMAHRAALAAGGHTVVVSASGLGRPFPAGDGDLLTRITERGAIVTELPPHRAPTKWTFIQRGRLAAALTDAVLIVEAGFRSGSLNVAGHATALGRPLGAVPGPITSPTSAGCSRLIRDHGATLISTTDEAAALTTA
ncbi:DNA-processing protein DprA [Cryobacterium cryoconiti]|uniref:Smf/DprA SLOG domain-containing protein n=1 Tax=Cryobacterium cryoconiti TaxID=1259239 RepID=A0A4Y8JS96_9MICO|nr:DNA-processing protein DprA [Cryobacterium cryoconiti]TFD26998.1 hypothetical protein E3T49_14015 [Cryobacterium cryoconiti]